MVTYPCDGLELLLQTARARDVPVNYEGPPTRLQHIALHNLESEVCAFLDPTMAKQRCMNVPAPVTDARFSLLSPFVQNVAAVVCRQLFFGEVFFFF